MGERALSKLGRAFVVGGAGFIGSHLTHALLEQRAVTIFDNFSVGKREFIQRPLGDVNCSLEIGDALDLEHLTRAMKGHELVFHLAANPEARWGLDNPRLDLEQGTIATHNVLEAMRRNHISELVFASSGTVYGETDQACTELDLGHLPISLYGASKFACEGLISAWVECFGLSAWILRFGNVVGPHGTHGAALDFLKRLKANPALLEVLGDGHQAKPYVHVADLVRAILFVYANSRETLNVFNIAPPDVTSVRDIAELCVALCPHPTAQIRYTGGKKGWRGDVPFSRLDAGKLRKLGFDLGRSSRRAVETAVSDLVKEVWS
jgi:UDP-glucose 4-epimerase